MDEKICFAIVLVTAGAAGHGVTTLSSKTTPHRISLMHTNKQIRNLRNIRHFFLGVIFGNIVILPYHNLKAEACPLLPSITGLCQAVQINSRPTVSSSPTRPEDQAPKLPGLISGLSW